MPSFLAPHSTDRVAVSSTGIRSSFFGVSVSSLPRWAGLFPEL